MKNAQKKGLMIIAVLAIVPVIFLTNCKVGLGTAVDTKAPTVAITYPSTDSVIRGTFVMSGTADDETGVSSVKVVLTKLPAALGIKSEEITGSMDTQNGKTWTASINTPDAATGAYSIADGKYEAQVTVTDTVGRTTSTTVIYSIDNTRPIVAVSQPGTRGTQNPWEFGSELNFTGLQYDENISGVFTIDFYSADGAKISTYKGANVLTDWALDVKEDSAAFQALKKAMADVNIPQKFWYAITVEDLAYEFTNPAEASDTVKTGNSSTYYYSWTDISSLLVAGDFAPKINALYNLDSGLNVSASEMPASITYGKLKDIRIQLNTAADKVASEFGAFTIDPNNKQPVIETDGIQPGENRSKENQIGKGETLRFEIKKNKDNTPILVNEMKTRLDTFTGNAWVEGTSTPIALTDITQGTTIVYNYSAPVEVGIYRLVFDVKDLNKSSARNSTYEFIVNAGAPTFTIAPGASIYAPSGTFTAKITALDDSNSLNLKVQQRTAGGLTEVTAYPDTITTTEVSGTESNYTSVWTLTLPAAADGSSITYRFEVSDGKWSNSKEQKITTDNTPPKLLKITTPEMSSLPPEPGVPVISSPTLSIVAQASSDVKVAKLIYTKVKEPSDPVTAPSEDDAGWTSANVSADGEGRITGTITLPTVAKDGKTLVEEGTYYIWYCFADDTYDDVTKQMGPVQEMFHLIADRNDPNLTFTINTKLEEDFPVLDGYRKLNKDFTIAGKVWDAVENDDEGIVSLVYSRSVNGVEDITNTEISDRSNGVWSLDEESGDGKFDYTITATDKAGKKTVKTVKIHKDILPPELKITQPKPDATAVAGNPYIFKGTAEDPGSGIAQLQIRIINTVASTDTNWLPISSSTSAWSYTATAGDMGGEGNVKVYLWAIDGIGLPTWDKTDLATVVNTPEKKALYYREFFYDATPPSLNLGSAETTFYANSGTYTFTGINVSDNGGLSSLTYTLGANSESSNYLTPPLTTWTDDVAVTGLEQGNNTVTFTLKDVSGNMTTKTITIVYDTKPPVIDITSVIPSIEDGSNYKVNGVIKVTGSFLDERDGSASIYSVTERSGNDSAFADSPAPASSPSGFTVYVDTRNVSDSDGIAVTTLADAFAFSVEDKMGNAANTLDDTDVTNVMTQLRKYVIDQETDKPSIEVDSFKITEAADETYVGPAPKVNLFTTGESLKANITDDDGISRIDFYTDGDITTPVYSIGAVTLKNKTSYSLNLKISELPLSSNETHDLMIKVTDTKLGATDIQGRYETPWFYIGIAKTGEPKMTVDNAVGGTIGTIEIAGKDEELIKFGQLTETKTISGKSEGSYNITGVVINSYNKTGSENVFPAGSVGNETWSFDLTKPGTSVEEIIAVTASDSFGRNVIKRFSYIFDLDKPEMLTIAAPNEYFKKAEGVLINGTAQDFSGAPAVTQSGLKSIEYAVLPGENNTDTTSAEWKSLTTSSLYSWSGVVNEFAAEDDGWYTVHIHSVDNSGNVSESLSKSVYADSTPPVITTTKDGSSESYSKWFDKGSFSLKGTLTEDTFQYGSMTEWNYKMSYQADTESSYSATPTELGEMSALMTGSNSWFFPSTTGDDGKYKYVITATDKAGYTSVITREIFIDTAPPNLGITNLSNGTVVTTSDYTYRGTLGDDSAGPRNVYYQITQNITPDAAGTNPVGAGYIAVDAKNGSWSITKDNLSGTDAAAAITAGKLCEGQWYLHILADDTAGNLTTVETIDFIVDTGLPAIDETLINPILNPGDPGYPNNPEDPINRIALFDSYITISDTNALKSLEVVQKRDGGEALTLATSYTVEKNGIVEYKNLPYKAGATPVALDGTADGLYTYEITVTDFAGRTETIKRTVRFDSRKPEISLSVPADGSYYGSTINLSGSVTDANGLVSSSYTIGAGDVPFGNAVRLEASLTGLTEGSNSITIKTQDIPGNPQTLTRNFYVDTAAPVLTVDGSASQSIMKSATSFVISGALTDTYKDKVEIYFNGELKDTITTFTGNSWNSSNLLTQVLPENQTITVKVVGYDKAKKTAEKSITVFRDTQAPVVEILSVDNQLNYPIDTPTYTNAVNGTIIVTGKVTDNNTIKPVTCTLTNGLYTFTTAPVALVNSNFTFNIDTKTVTFNGSTPDDYDMTVTVNAEDAAGNTGYDTSDPVHVIQASDNPVVSYSNLTSGGTAAQNLFGTLSNNKILGTFTDDDGLTSVNVKIDAGTATTVPGLAALNNTTSRSFSYDVSGLTEGVHTIAFVLTDKNGLEVTTAPENFAVDAADPVIAVTTQQNSFLPASTEVTVTGTASDGNGFTSIVDTTTSTPVTLAEGFELDNKVSTIEWSYTFTTPAVTGPASQSFTAKDAFGKVSTVAFTYKVDATPPSLTVTSTPASDYLNMPSNYTYRVTGTASDSGVGASGLNDVRYVILDGNNDTIPAPADASWKPVAGLGSWTVNADFSGMPSGVYSLYIMARDNAGNSAVTAKKLVYVDTQNPALSVTSVSPNTVFNANFAISGNASDPDGYLEKVTAQYTGLATPAELLLTEGPWSYTVPVAALGENNYTLTITAFDRSGKTSTYTKSFTVDRTAPEVSFNGITATIDPLLYTNFIDSDPKVYVNLTDDNGISTAVVQFRKESGDTPVAQIEIPGFVRNRKSYSFALAMKEILGDGNLTDGVWRAEIVSTDVTDNTSNTVTSSYFRVDRNNPTVSVPKIFTGGTEVTNGFVTSGVNYTVSGTMSDGDGGIKSVEVQLKHDNTIIPINSHDREPADISTPGVWTVDIGDVFALTGSYDLVVIATDNAGRTKEEKLVLQCDITKPEIVFISPFAKDATQPATMIGEITLSGKSIDSAMSKNWYAVGGDLDEATGIVTQKSSGPVIDWLELVDKPYNWDTTINTSAAATASFAVQVGGATSTIWDLPVHIKAMDVSGNIAYDTLVIRIDTDKDKPVVEIQSPNNGETVGGQFSITGSANDDNFIHSVYMQVEVVGASYSSNVLTKFTGSEVLEGVDANGDPQTHYFTRIGDEPSAWYKISGYDKYAWVFTLNKLKEFNKEVLQGNGVTFTQAELDRENSSTTTKLIIRVKAYDTKTQGTFSGSIFGYYDEIELTLQSGAPSILIDDMPVHNEYISGTVNTNFTVVDDEGIESVNISIGGVPKIISYGDVTDSPTVINGYTVEGSDPNTIGATTYFKTWTVTNEWDTTSITAPSVALTIEATDYSATSPKTTMNNRTALIDNTAPVFNYHTDNTRIKGDVDRAHTTDSIAMLGSAAGIYGNTRDDGSRINKVIVYFTKTVGGVTSIYTMGGTTIDTGSVLTSTITINGTAHPFPVANISLIVTGRTDGGDPQKYIVIDKAEGGRDSSEVGDNDGYNEQMYPSGEWYVKPDSTKLNDGVYDLHCVVVDNAGNIAYAADKILVQNNKPTITSIDLYTDINMSNGIDAADGYTNIPVAELDNAAAFKVRNNQFQIKINASAANGGLTYELTYPTGNSHTETSPGHFILENLGNNGEKDFSVCVSDSLGLESAVYSFTVTYENTDTQDPLAGLFDLNTDIAKGANINKGSISPDGGHIEPRVLSVYDGDDPDVSGKIILRGTASDNQRLTSVSLTLGSEDITILSWNGTEMVPATWDAGNSTWVPVQGASVVSQSLSVGGHELEWAYVWDTSTVQDSVGIKHAYLNAEVSVHAVDASSRGSIDDVLPGTYNTMTVDVMPYITKVTTGLSLIKKNNPSIFNRTALGHYPVSSTESVLVKGYNLTTAIVSPASGTPVTILEDADATTINTFVIPAATIADHASGNLVLTVNSIPLLNNYNDNTVETNQTPNGENNPLLTDDVYLDIWNIDSDAVKSVRGAIKEPVMKVNPATGADGRVGFAFANGVDTFSMANGTTNSYTRWQRNYADYGEVAFGFDDEGRSHGIVIGHDTEPNSGYTGRMNYITSRWGVPLTDARDNFRFYRKLRIESCGLPVGSQLNGANVPTRIIDTTRFQSPSLAVASSAARTEPTVYLAYYDNLQEQIRFRWGTNNVATRNNVTRAQTGFNQFYDVDTAADRNGTGEYDYGDHVIFEPDASRYSLIAGDENDGTGNTGNTAGQYVAIDVIPGANANADIVTIVWYDGADLWYIYRANTKNDVNASKAAAVMDGTNVLWSKPVKIFTGAGIDCAIAVDDAATPGIHIAGYDRINGALRYAYLSSYDDTTPDTCVVDDYDIVGTKITITTVIKDYDHDNNPATAAKNGVVPYISYYMASTQRPKLAYLVDPSSYTANTHGSDENTSAFTGKWEITLIPTTSIVNEDRINVDFWRNSDGTAKNSTLTTNTGDAQSGSVYGNGTANPILGYAVTKVTDGFIETAQLK